MKKLAEKAQEKLVQEVDHGYDVGTEQSKEMLVQEVDCQRFGTDPNEGG